VNNLKDLIFKKNVAKSSDSHPEIKQSPNELVFAKKLKPM
jgi:hypothetical protein